MSPCRHYRQQPRSGFPRVSGDEPRFGEGEFENVLFSPRERG